ncbi:MAG: lasso RiPP family leader peptide-containing protein [Methylovirgula sp.]
MSEKNTVNFAAGDKVSKHLKRAYSKPTVVRHGDLREITLHVGSKGKYDGSSKSPYNTA